MPFVGVVKTTFILREQLGGRPPARLILEIDVGKLLAVAVAHREPRLLFLDRPGRREATASVRGVRLLRGPSQAGPKVDEAIRSAAWHHWRASILSLYGRGLPTCKFCGAVSRDDEQFDPG